MRGRGADRSYRMAEEAKGIQSKAVLIIAVILAVVMVAIYNFHIAFLKKALQPEKVKLLKTNRDLKPGDRVTAKDVVTVEVEKASLDAIGSVVTDMTVATGNPVNQAVEKDRFLLWSYFTSARANPTEKLLAPNMVAHALPVDPKYNLGPLLQPGAFVNIIGLLPDGKGLQMMRIMENAKVVSVGGKTGDTVNDRSGGVSSGQYRNIVIEVSPKVSLQLANVLTRVQGEVRLELANTSNVENKPAELRPEVLKWAGSAEAPTSPVGPVAPPSP